MTDEYEGLSIEERLALVRRKAAEVLAEDAPSIFEEETARQQIEEMTKEAPQEFITRQKIAIDAKAQAARLRAHRANMMKKLNKVFSIYEGFTAQEAANRTATDVRIVEGYLALEVEVSGSVIRRNATGGFMIISPFD